MSVVRHEPYQSGAANDLYHLLFCDEPALFGARAGQTPTAWQEALFAEPPDSAALLALANDPSQEGRVRYLAFSRLRATGASVAAKGLSGVIVEVPLDGGLDTLAAFSEGGVRYLNHTGKASVFEGVDALKPFVDRLFAASEPVVARIGPWEQPRRPPPAHGNIRLTFLVSDGLYFGEGPMIVMQRDPMAGPIIQRATELLQTIVPLATGRAD